MFIFLVPNDLSELFCTLKSLVFTYNLPKGPFLYYVIKKNEWVGRWVRRSQICPHSFVIFVVSNKNWKMGQVFMAFYEYLNFKVNCRDSW